MYFLFDILHLTHWHVFFAPYSVYIFLLQTLHLLSDIATFYPCSVMLLNIACQHSVLSSCLLHFCTLCQTLGVDTECSCYMPPATSSGTATTTWLPHPICGLHHTHRCTHTSMRHIGITLPSWSSHCGVAGVAMPE